MQTNHPTSIQETIRRYGLQNGANRLPYGIGCAWLGQRNPDRHAALKDAINTLETAYRLGFRYFDTAPAYGESETFLGEFIPSVPRESIFVASKIELHEVSDPKQVTQFVQDSLAASLERLHTDHLDLCQIHDIYELNLVFGEGGALEALLEAKKQGLIRAIGMATRPHDLLQAAAAHDGFDTILTYADYTPLKNSAAAIIEFARECGKGVINANPLSHMLRKMSASELRRYESYPDFALMQQITHQFDGFAALCQARGISLLQAALHFPLTNPEIDITLTGPANAQEVQSTFQALQTPVEREFYEQWQSPRKP